MSHESAIASRPRHQPGYGGIANVASSARRARIAATSPLSKAFTKRSTRFRTRASPRERTVACWLRFGRRLSEALRARWSALFTEATVVARNHRDLLGGKAEDISQDEHRALLGRQLLQRCDERQLYGLAPLVAGIGRAGPVLDSQPLIGVGLDPDRVVDGYLRLGRRTVVDREDPFGAPPDRVDTNVGRDTVKPCPERALTPVGGKRPPGPQQRLLERVLGVVDRSQHAVAVGLEGGTLPLEQPLEDLHVAAPRRVQWSPINRGMCTGCVPHSHDIRRAGSTGFIARAQYRARRASNSAER
jgi:hypothetical protein